MVWATKLLPTLYNLVKHIDIFFIKNLVWATSLNFPISIPAFDDLDNLSEDDDDEEAMLNLVESLYEDYEENFTQSINIMEILDEVCNQSCETVQQRE